MATPVLVLPMKTKGLDGDPKVFGIPKIFPLIPFEEAISKIYPYDAMIAMYRVLGDDKCCRVNKTGYQFLAESDQEIVAEYVFVDVDNENHAPWKSTEEIVETYNKLRATEITRNAGFYATRHGYRLFWRLPKPVDVKYFESLSQQLIQRLAQDGINADEGCTDWTRLFRLPFATPEGAGKHISLPSDFSHGELSWWPEHLAECRMQKILPGVAETWPDRAPAVVPPDPSDYALLKGETEIYNRLKKGQPIADAGNRFKTIMRAVGVLSNKLENPSPEAVYKALAYSVAMLSAEKTSGGRPHTVETLWEACKSICAIVISQRREEREQVERINALAIRRDSQQRNQNNSGAAISGDIVEYNGESFSNEESTGADFLENGVEPPDDFGDDISQIPLKQRCILFTNAKAYYVFNQKTGLYQGPFEGTGLPAMLEKYCPQIAKPIRNGKTNAIMPTSELLSRYGTEVNRITATIGRRGIRFDVTNKVIDEGVAAIRRDIKATFHQDIDTWLRIMGGSHADKLLDWLATFTELHSPTCGLYLKSTGGTGKGLLASGLARLWGTAPTMYQNIIGTHNDGIANCPLVWADEEIPSSSYGKTPSAVFRTLVGNSDFNLRRMYAPAATLRGCLRLLVTANNNNALKIDEDLSHEDFEAIVERIGYIQVPDAARVYLENLGGRAATRSWVDNDKIAEHVLWLAQNRKVTRGKRFLVRGWKSSLYKHLQTTSGVAGLVVEVIAYAISTAQSPSLGGSTATPRCPKGFTMGNDNVYATVSGVVSMWENALGDKARVASKQRILAALKQLSSYDDMVTIEVNNGYNNEIIKMWPIQSQKIVEAIDQYQLGDPDAIAGSIKNTVIRVR
jgi:hypothetical protein